MKTIKQYNIQQTFKTIGLSILLFFASAHKVAATQMFCNSIKGGCGASLYHESSSINNKITDYNQVALGFGTNGQLLWVQHDEPVVNISAVSTQHHDSNNKGLDVVSKNSNIQAWYDDVFRWDAYKEVNSIEYTAGNHIKTFNDDSDIELGEVEKLYDDKQKKSESSMLNKVADNHTNENELDKQLDELYGEDDSKPQVASNAKIPKMKDLKKRFSALGGQLNIPLADGDKPNNHSNLSNEKGVNKQQNNKINAKESVKKKQSGSSAQNQVDNKSQIQKNSKKLKNKPVALEIVVKSKENKNVPQSNEKGNGINEAEPNKNQKGLLSKVNNLLEDNPAPTHAIVLKESEEDKKHNIEIDKNNLKAIEQEEENNRLKEKIKREKELEQSQKRNEKLANEKARLKIELDNVREQVNNENAEKLNAALAKKQRENRKLKNELNNLEKQKITYKQYEEASVENQQLKKKIQENKKKLKQRRKELNLGGNQAMSQASKTNVSFQINPVVVFLYMLCAYFIRYIYVNFPKFNVPMLIRV